MTLEICNISEFGSKNKSKKDLENLLLIIFYNRFSRPKSVPIRLCLGHVTGVTGHKARCNHGYVSSLSASGLRDAQVEKGSATLKQEVVVTVVRLLDFSSGGAATASFQACRGRVRELQEIE